MRQIKFCQCEIQVKVETTAPIELNNDGCGEGKRSLVRESASQKH